jgi:hypothetical protein
MTVGVEKYGLRNKPPKSQLSQQQQCRKREDEIKSP